METGLKDLLEESGSKIDPKNQIVLDILKKDKMMRLFVEAEDLAFERSKTHLKGNGNFKITQKEFRTEMALMYMMGSMCGVERLWRVVDLDKELDSRDLIIGEFHLALLNIHEILKTKFGLNVHLQLNDLLDGKYSAANVEVETKRCLGAAVNS